MRFPVACGAGLPGGPRAPRPLTAAIQLLTGGALLALSVQATAEPDGFQSHTMEHVLVTVPIHKKSAETALPVSVLSGDELHQRAALSIGATLAQQPGLHNASFGPAVGQPVIRGHAGPRVRVLQNGLSSADAASSSADHATAVEPLLADAVEVVRGPATLLYGGGAIGGVVNVIDNRIPRSRPDGEMSGALEYRHDSATAGDSGVFRLDGGEGDIAFHLSGLHRDWNDVKIPGRAFDRTEIDDLAESSDGFIANSSGRQRSVTAGASWWFDSGHIGFALSDSELRYGIPRGGHIHGGDSDDHDHDDAGHDHHAHHDELSVDHGDILIDMAQRRYDLSAEWHPHGAVLDGLRARLAYTDYEHRELERDAVATTFTNESWEGRLELIHGGVAGWHGVVGLQFQQTDFAAVGEESFIPASQRRALGFFILEDFHAGDWIYELGLRLDSDAIDADGQRDRRFTSLSGSAAALWEWSPGWQLGLSLAAAERAPVVEELYSNAGQADWHLDHFHFHAPVTHAATQTIELGSDKLRQEQSRNVDLSFRYDGGHGQPSAEVTLFYNDFRDYIYLADTGFSVEGVEVYAHTQQDARFYGVEAEWQLPLSAGRAGSFELTLYGDAVHGQLGDEQGKDDAVPRLPPYRLGARLDWERDALRGHIDLLHAAEQTRAGHGEADTDSYQRLDVGLSYTLASAPVSTTLFLRGTNLTNEEIRSSTSFLRAYAPEPGRSIEAGVRLQF